MIMHKIIQRASHTRPSARGFTLLEVMVALVIFSIGLLGLAALQGRAVSYNNGAYHRSLATFLISDIMDRMRANRTAAINGAYDIALGTTPPAGTCDGTSANCNSAQQATADLYEWTQSLGALPGGEGAVVRTVTGASTVFTVTVRWTDPNANGGKSQLAVKGEL